MSAPTKNCSHSLFDLLSSFLTLLYRFGFWRLSLLSINHYLPFLPNTHLLTFSLTHLFFRPLPYQVYVDVSRLLTTTNGRRMEYNNHWQVRSATQCVFSFCRRCWCYCFAVLKVYVDVSRLLTTTNGRRIEYNNHWQVRIAMQCNAISCWFLLSCCRCNGPQCSSVCRRFVLHLSAFTNIRLTILLCAM